MSSEKSPTALKTIGEVAEDIDVATHVLRFWESKFHQIKPQKRRGRRYYRPEDVVIITQIKALLYGQGYTIRGVQKYLASEFKMKAADNKNVAPEQEIEQPEVKSEAKVLNIPQTAVPFAIQMPQAQQPVSPFSVLRPAPQNFHPNPFARANHVNQNAPAPAAVTPAQQAASRLVQEAHKEQKDNSFNQDLFGHPVKNGEEEAPVEQKRFSNEDVQKLKHIYNSMINMREQLQALA